MVPASFFTIVPHPQGLGIYLKNPLGASNPLLGALRAFTYTKFCSGTCYYKVLQSTTNVMPTTAYSKGYPI